MNFVKAITLLLLVVHGFLAVWAIVGFAERFWATPPWPRISNALFPEYILFMQWTLTLAAATVFLLGYVIRWKHTSIALGCVYAAMAVLCAVETFGYMESDSRFVAMGAEYLAYAAILAFLLPVACISASMGWKQGRSITTYSSGRTDGRCSCVRVWHSWSMLCGYSRSASPSP